MDRQEIETSLKLLAAGILAVAMAHLAGLALSAAGERGAEVVAAAVLVVPEPTR